VKVISAPKSFFAIVHVSWGTSLTLQICEQMPTYTIAANAGVEGAVVVGKLLEQNNLDIGYDAARGMLPVLHVHHNILPAFLSYLTITLTMDQGLIPLSIMIEDHTAGMFLTSGSIRYNLTEVTGNWSRNGSLCCGHLKKSGT
jgi:hypothetical protein